MAYNVSKFHPSTKESLLHENDKQVPNKTKISFILIYFNFTSDLFKIVKLVFNGIISCLGAKQYQADIIAHIHIKVNESQYVALFVFSGSIKKIFSIDCVNIYIFSIFFSKDFFRWKSLGLPHIVYIVIH